MKSLPTIFCVILSMIGFQAKAQSINENWKQELAKAVAEFKSCKQDVADNVNPCSKFTGESLKTVYKLDDFYSAELKRYLTGSEIVKFLEGSSKWTKSGSALNQETLNMAQNNANKSIAVVAVYADEDGLGHVALILPGELSTSGTWSRNVPNCASFFMNTPEKSFSEKGLSYAFSKSMINKVIIYTRKGSEP